MNYYAKRVVALLSLPNTTLSQTESAYNVYLFQTITKVTTGSTFGGCWRRDKTRRNRILRRIQVCAHTETQHISSTHRRALPARLLLPTWRGARGSGGRRSAAEESPPPPIGEIGYTARESLVTKRAGYAWHTKRRRCLRFATRGWRCAGKSSHLQHLGSIVVLILHGLPLCYLQLSKLLPE